MIKIFDRVYIGKDDECFTSRMGWVAVHACKSPCHQRAVGYKGSLPAIHPNYLILETENNLFMNLIDRPVPLFQKESFDAFLKFAAKKHNDGKSLLIHCNQGESRAPSLAMLLLAKKLEIISSDSFQTASDEFIKLYPGYNPGQGIKTFLNECWDGWN